MSLVGIPLTAAVANHAGSLPVDDAEPYYDLSCLLGAPGAFRDPPAASREASNDRMGRTSSLAHSREAQMPSAALRASMFSTITREAWS